MMRTILFTALIFAALLLTTTCKKSGSTPNAVRQFKGKMVVNTCGLFVVDIDKSAGAGQGQVWVAGSTTYNNAAGVINYCYLMDNNIVVGDSVAFNISATNVSPGTTCAVPACAMQGNPVKSIYLTDVVKIK